MKKLIPSKYLSSFVFMIIAVITACTEKNQTDSKSYNTLTVIQNATSADISADFYGENKYLVQKEHLISIDIDSLNNCYYNSQLINIEDLEDSLVNRLFYDTVHAQQHCEMVYLKHADSVFSYKDCFIKLSVDKFISYSAYEKMQRTMYDAYEEVRYLFSYREYGIGFRELINSNENSHAEMMEEVYKVYPIRLFEEVTP